MTIEPENLSTRDACKFIGAGKTWLYAAAARGEIERLKAGRKTLWPVASLRAYIARLPRVPAKAA